MRVRESVRPRSGSRESCDGEIYSGVTYHEEEGGDEREEGELWVGRSGTTPVKSSKNFSNTKVTTRDSVVETRGHEGGHPDPS